jgi:hypothetical protein
MGVSRWDEKHERKRDESKSLKVRQHDKPQIMPYTAIKSYLHGFLLQASEVFDILCGVARILRVLEAFADDVRIRETSARNIADTVPRSLHTLGKQALYF